MEYTGNLLKMKSELTDQVDYYLNISDEQLPMNECIGHKVSLMYQHQINCIRCGRKTNKSFFQGFCYPCFINAPEADECILRPEKCMAHEGISRDMEWSKTHCLIDHYVYLALSSGLKVGVTRNTQVPTRWIDQGAYQAVKIAKTPNRHIAGLIEVDLKNHFADKTHWQRMLKNQIPGDIDLIEEKQKAYELADEEYRGYFIDDDELTEIVYPVNNYPVKVKSINLDKTDKFKGKLTGIKGQYLIFEGGFVFNVRKHNGYLVKIEVL